MGFEAGSDHKILLSRVYLKIEENCQIIVKKPSKQVIPSKILEQKIGCFQRQDNFPLKLERIIKIHKKNYAMAVNKQKIFKNQDYQEENLSVFEVTKLLLIFVNPKFGKDYYVQQFQEKAKEFYDI